MQLASVPKLLTCSGRKSLRFVLSRFFEDSPELLVLNLLEHEEIDSKQLTRLRRRIEES